MHPSRKHLCGEFPRRYYLPDIDEYPNVLTSCCGPTLLVADFEIGDHSLTVPSPDADNSC